MTQEQIHSDALVIWNYMQFHDKLEQSDAIFCLCSHDTRVAVRAAKLFLDGYGELLIISGGVGKLTRDIFTESEAEVFKKIALKQGVPESKILLEPNSTNTGENIRFTYDLLKNKALNIKSFILVQKPYMERRTYATFKKQWPDSQATIRVTSPRMTFEDYVSEGISKDDVINIMVGDLQRIREYPRLGYQVEQSIPDDVWRAYERLVDQGYDKHLLLI